MWSYPVRQDLGKFFFGVSSGTVAALVSLEKLGDSPKLDMFFGLSLACLLFAALVALSMAVPRKWLLTEATDLYAEYAEYAEHVTAVRRYTMAWVISWIVGVGVGIRAVLWT